ncbi:hypothetical protein V7793_00480 [Streptomyces sp. KLMMK]|uniref:hypothetical protein n=1 Tax=Streptomyces sp. KLMMK TaxID=3109353 RepID=UPI002FFE8C31
MSAPADPVGGGGLLLPAERVRRAVGHFGIVLTVVAGLALLEAVTFLGVELLSDAGMETAGLPGVAEYAPLPVAGGVLTLPVFLRSWRWPALRIDAAGISKVQRHRVETLAWSALDAVQFTPDRGVLVLLVRAGATLPWKDRVLDRPLALPYYALGNVLRPRRRREHHDLIVAAVERFAPGAYTDRPWRLGKPHHKAAPER